MADLAIRLMRLTNVTVGEPTKCTVDYCSCIDLID